MNIFPSSSLHRHWWLAALFTAIHCGARAGGAWQAGLDLSIEGSAGLQGGSRTGHAWHGLALAYADWAQTETKAADFGLTGRLSALALAGRGPTERFLGDFLAASNSEGHRSVRLYSSWIEARRGGWSVRGGTLLADEEFAGTAAGACFFNSAFGWPAFVSANTLNTGPAFYVATLGLRVEHQWNETTTWRLGVYDGDAFDSPTGDPAVTRHGLHHEVGGDQGWFLMSEGTFSLTGGATRFKVGAWLHTAAFADMRDDATGQPFALSGHEPREHGANFGGYAVIEHTLAGRPDEAGHVEYFVRGGISPADRNTLGWALDAGVAWTGPVPGRPKDVAALGVAHARFSRRYADGVRLADPAAATPDFEQVIELSYTVALNENLTIQPDLQFIRHPGGSAAQRDALVFLLRLNRSY